MGCQCSCERSPLATSHLYVDFGEEYSDKIEIGGKHNLDYKLVV